MRTYFPLALSTAWALACPVSAGNIILIIGDGMGPQQIEAARLYDVGPDAQLEMQKLPVQGWVRTDPVGGGPTDSAAAATAMATGQKVVNDVVSRAIPGDGSDLKTILELASEAGWSTGLVSTSYITHATPAAFGAHAFDRGHLEVIADYYLNHTRPNVLMGGGHDSILDLWNEQSGYTLVRDRDEMLASAATADRVLGAFGDGHMPYLYDGLGNLPRQREVALTAIANLERNPKGFFLMIEGGLIDRGGHINENDPTKTGKVVEEVVEFDRTIKAVLDWAQDRTDTMVLVTADHETGDLTVQADNGIGVLPTVHWGGHEHTGINVPVFAWGAGVERLHEQTVENTELFHVMNDFLTRPAPIFAIRDVAFEGDEVVLTWNSETGKRYDIEASDQLSTGWQTVRDGIDSEGDRTRATVESFTTRPERRFYRVVELE